ncbi:hypothetical protein [Bradyrhizobium erythrophlei]|uniref:hypothetical protein n=1 Tax=Bradyrhizobium erythrophlei TaxID=1437360 RepID=UPI0012AB88DF|nr:hypothetical protein [Bradyrhizobium erythrophlei]
MLSDVRYWGNSGKRLLTSSSSGFDPMRILRSDGVQAENSWKWIDPHGKEFGIERPYFDKDPPHVGPIDSREYADKRGRPNAQLAELETKGATGQL